MMLGQPLWYWALVAVAVTLIGASFWLTVRRDARRHARFMRRLDDALERADEDAAWRWGREDAYLLALQLRRDRLAPLVIAQEIAKLRGGAVREVAPGVYADAQRPALRAVELQDAS